MDLRIVHPTDVPSAEIWLAEEEGVLVCRVRAVSETPFDGDCALRVGIALPDAARWMADYRYSPYWCRPAFGEALGDVGRVAPSAELHQDFALPRGEAVGVCKSVDRGPKAALPSKTARQATFIGLGDFVAKIQCGKTDARHVHGHDDDEDKQRHVD